MGKKNDKKLCWNCDGSVALHLDACPYCGVDLTNPPAGKSPIESSSYLGHPFQKSFSGETPPKSPYANIQNSSVTEEEWKNALEKEEVAEEIEQEKEKSSKSEMIALLLLLPGVVFFLFGLVLLLFSDNGILTLEWNQSFAYFYFLGALPLLVLGWRALK